MFVYNLLNWNLYKNANPKIQDYLKLIDDPNEKWLWVWVSKTPSRKKFPLQLGECMLMGGGRTELRLNSSNNSANYSEN